MNKIHQDAYKKFNYISELGHMITVWNSTEGKVPMTMVIDKVKYQHAAIQEQYIYRNYKPKEGEYFFTRLLNSEIKSLIALNVEREKEKLLAENKKPMNRRERKKYEQRLWNHYLSVPIVRKVEKKSKLMQDEE